MFVLVAGATAWVALRYRRGRLAALWALIMIGPAYNLIPYTGRPIGENRLFLPSVGTCLLAALALAALTRRQGRDRRMAAGLTWALVALYAALLLARQPVWRSPRAYWRDMVRKSPGWPEGSRSLGQVYMESRLPESGVALLERAVACRDSGTPPQTQAEYCNALGLAYHTVGRIEDATAAFGDSLRLAPDRVDVRFRLAACRADSQEIARARDELKAELRARPNWAEGWYLLGQAHTLTGDTAAAQDAFRKADRLASR